MLKVTSDVNGHPDRRTITRRADDRPSRYGVRMTNYAETLAYWYLRLNGFFPLNRFVLHPKERGERAYGELAQGADHDLLALRPPGVFEEVGGQPNDWDDRLFRALGVHPDVTTVGLVVQVKGGDSPAEPGPAFQEDRLDYAVKRLGMLGSNDYVKADVVQALTRHAKYELSNPSGGPPHIVVAKLVIGGCFNGAGDEPQFHDGYFSMSLRHAVTIIKKRVEEDWKTRKQGDWDHFPGDLIQFLIWERDQLRPHGWHQLQPT